MCGQKFSIFNFNYLKNKKTKFYIQKQPETKYFFLKIVPIRLETYRFHPICERFHPYFHHRPTGRKRRITVLDTCPYD